MRRATILASGFLIARLTGAQMPEGIQVIGNDNARVTAIVATKDSALFSMSLPDGSHFAVRTDSATMCAWADNADLLTNANATARVQGITFVRLSADSNSRYRVIGEDGDRRAGLVLAPDTARMLFGAMRGERQTRALPPSVIDDFLHPEPLTPAHVIHAPKIQYPESLRAMHFDGDVLLSCSVDSTGRVDRNSIKVLQSTDPAFTSAAKDALLHTYFAPAVWKGHHMATVVRQPYHFSINDQ